ncbi:hypothetical protein [Gandjariella thermophila]|uniref:hypothetical protein n=1 Tax=Gandjariella thermophila TaxID=1931992 RepID=UPI001CEFB044|nr:hypothetical protein [Gandjariella thermophila]
MANVADQPAAMQIVYSSVIGRTWSTWQFTDNGSTVLRHPRGMAGCPDMMMEIVPVRTAWRPGLAGPFVLADFPTRHRLFVTPRPHSAIFPGVP